MRTYNGLEIPYTAGRYYEYITQEEFDAAWDKKEHYSYAAFIPGERYILYRVAYNDDGRTVFMKIRIRLESLDENEMLFSFLHGTKGKTMLTKGFQKHWTFVPDVHDMIEEML